MTDQAIEWGSETLQAAFERCKAASLKDGLPSVDVRVDRLQRAIDLLHSHGQEIVDAISDDFGHRNAHTSWLSDIASSLKSLKEAKKNVAKWMKTQTNPVTFPLGLLGVRGRVMWQPKGVVGIISPWNYPVSMLFQPLAGALAAGNRVMLKPSENTPATSALIAELTARYFQPDEMICITGGPEVSALFSSLPLDHIFFTGATSIGSIIMGAAAKNLTPVTLELGGKSPVIMGSSADLEKTAQKLATTKLLNAGQTCVAPDYVLIDKDRQEDFAESYAAQVSAMYPSMLDNDDYTSIINSRHRERLEGYLADAEEKGAEIRVINPSDESFAGQNRTNKTPPALVLNVTDDMKIMQEEIFGPLLPVKTVPSTDDAIDYINAKNRPLALYYFGSDKDEIESVKQRTVSGATGVNEALFQVAQETLPFGGVGHSGMGNYHGIWGFRTFSHEKTVFASSQKMSIAKLAGLVPPYGSLTDKMIKRETKAS